jgi:O-antigen/teichoic acid export membrane protein
VKHTVRHTLLWLGAGVVAQRLLQLVAFVLIGRALGVAGLGVFAQGMATAAVLTVLAGAGVRNLVARAVARSPAAARSLVLCAVRWRL